MEPRGKAWRVLIAGGGTGGHLFPGIATAEALLARHPQADIRFVGSPYGIEARIIPARGYRIYQIPVRGLYGVSWRRRLWVLGRLPWALLKCGWILLCFRPQLVLGVGGYASGPMLLMALLFFRCTVIQEQNVHPGITNRLLGRWVRLAFVPFEGMQGFFPRSLVVGNPVREAIAALRKKPAPQPRPLRLLICGGSQGAHRINEAMIQSAPLLARWQAAAPGAALELYHQSGTADAEQVSAAYQSCGLAHRVLPFIEDMADALHGARLVLSRAGASALSEIIVARRAALYIPIPGSSGEHQRKNAQRAAEAGAALLLEQDDLNGATLAHCLISLLEDAPRLDAMEAATDALYAGDAAARIVTACEGLLA